MATYRFADGSEFNSESGEVRRPDGVSRLEPQPATLLALLAERAGYVVSHDEIARRIWGETTHVNFRQSIHYGIRQIRSVLGDATSSPRTIESIPRRGYRLRHEALAPLALADQFGARPAGQTDPEAPRVRPLVTRRRAVVIVGLTAALVATLWVERRPNTHHETAVRVLETVHDLVY